MKKSVRAAATAILAAPLIAAVFAAPASAEEHDLVTLTADHDGTTVTVNIVNDHNKDVTCSWNAEHESAPENSFGIADEKVKKNKTETFTEENVAEGSYTLTWNCSQRDNSWGTGDDGTAAPTEFTIGDDNDGGGTGSWGSLSDFDFGNLIGNLDFLGSLGSDNQDDGSAGQE
ncbi:hypothetical protein BFN03_04180 [Rhodococcus sp. WMMA185]|uniref:hypothetical protein n=1 Tax=Rhodococcus sp. WMMA185 TaxID=679318 RepID=UPI00087874D3|nr:hypothetical protein [Rhodococcus sp. WMMA185]AOW92177.1 hypothetical protein BFN03_04180 [Rhodococcus sp. WMMA185]